MAEEGTLCINADVLKMAGARASSTSTAEAYTNVYIKMAEAQLAAAARYDWVTNYASVSTIGKQILKDAASSYAAFKALDYDPKNLLGNEYNTKINTLWAAFQKVITLLEKDNNYINFIITGEGGNDDD